MKRNFKIYELIWAILLAVFNVICFVTPSEAAGLTKFGGAFWVGYIFITIAFIGNLVCTYFAFKADNAKKMFYNIPLITISYTALIVMLVVGAVVMAIPNLPNWVGIIMCLLILAFNAIVIIKAGWASEEVTKIDEKVKTQTQFVKLLTVDAQNLVNRAQSDEAKAACKKVYEAIRYSDPMSNDALSDMESKITAEIDMFSILINENNSDKIKTIADEIVLLIQDRNSKCKALK